MADPSAEAGPAASDKDLPTEDNIRVVCRFRPLNDSEEKAGSKFVVKFPDEQCVHVSVRKKNDSFQRSGLKKTRDIKYMEYFYEYFFNRAKSTCLIKYSSQM